MDVRQLRYFLAVVDEGGVHAAAAKLFVAQPSVSQSIRSLERSLGAELFTRTGRRLKLTAAGEALIAPARHVLHWMDLSRAHVDAVTGLRTGRLVVATMPSQAVDPLPAGLDGFARTHPFVTVSLRAAATPSDVISAVHLGEVDLGIAAATEPLVVEGIVLLPIARQGFVVVAARDTDLPTGRPLTYADLDGHRLIAGQPGTGMRRVADEVVAVNSSTMIAIESEYRESILPMVLAGTGTAIMAESWGTIARHAGLRVHELVTEVTLEVAVLHRQTELTPAAQEFLRWIVPGTAPTSSGR